MDWFLGTMGFSYKQWEGPFYPAGLNARRFLAYYAERFNAVEMDSTFYGTPAPETAKRWTAVTPAEFVICPKVPRAITHDLRLRDADEPMGVFLDTLRLLEGNLGPILVQLPPDFTAAEVDALWHFVARLPDDLHFALEFRHRSWDSPQTAVLLENHNIAWVCADYIHMPKVVKRTADFLYLRFIGPHGQFGSKDREMVDKTADLQRWWEQLQPHLPHVDAVYAFFNNDYAGYSPETCNKFKRIVGVEVEEIRPLQQGRLF